MRTKRRARSSALLAASLGATGGLAGAVATSVTTGDAALAYPVGQLPSACNSPTTYSFDGSAWTTPKMNSIRAGIAEWGQVSNYSGSSLVSSSEVGSNSGAISITMNSGVAPSYAKASCSNGYIQFDPNAWPGASTLGMQSVAAHEMGHIWGLGHVGRYDNLRNTAYAPHMATCLDLETRASSSGFTDDDAGALTSRRQGNGLPNSSFESYDLRHWTLRNATSSQASVPSLGYHSRRYASQDWLDNYMRQRHTLWFQTTGNLTFSFSHRAVSSGTTGDVVGQVWTREYDYGMTGSQCTYPSSTASIPNLKANVRLVDPPWVLRGSAGQATSTTYQTNTVYVSAIPRGNAESYEFEVRIISNAKTASSQLAPIYVDAAFLTD